MPVQSGQPESTNRFARTVEGMLQAGRSSVSIATGMQGIMQRAVQQARQEAAAAAQVSHRAALQHAGTGSHKSQPTASQYQDAESALQAASESEQEGKDKKGVSTQI